MCKIFKSTWYIGIQHILLLVSRQVMSVSLWLQWLQHARLPCPSVSLRICSNSCPLSRWCHPTISSSFTPFSSCPQSFPASGSFLMNWLFASNGQSIGASASASILPMNIWDWFPSGLTGLISLLSKGLSRSSPASQFESINSSVFNHFYGPALTSIHDYWKNHTLTIWTFVGKVMTMLFNVLSSFVIAFLSRSKRLLISWLPSTSAVILEPEKIKSLFPLFSHLLLWSLYYLILIF